MSAAPNPSNLIVLGAIGIAAYWFMTRKAVAQAPTAAQIPSAGVASPFRSPLGDLATSLSKMLGGNPGAGAGVGTYDGRSATPWATDTSGGGGAGMANNPSAFVASSAVDGAAFNPPNSSVFDYLSGLQADNIL